MIQRTGVGEWDALIVFLLLAPSAFPKFLAWHMHQKIKHTPHIQNFVCLSRYWIFFDFFLFFRKKRTHVALITRRPKSSNYLAQTRPKTDLAHLTMPSVLGGQGRLSKSVEERTVERKDAALESSNRERAEETGLR
jgi:hypothetical protein